VDSGRGGRFYQERQGAQITKEMKTVLGVEAKEYAGASAFKWPEFVFRKRRQVD